jgi:phage gp29-like protein
VRPIVDLNRGPQKKYPRICIGRPDEVDVDALVKNVIALVPFGLPVSKKAMLAQDRPCRAQGRTRSCSSRQSSRRPSIRTHRSQLPTEAPALAVNSSEIQTKRDAIERAANDLLGDWEPLVKPIVAGLQAEIAAASSVDDVKALLAKQFAGLNVEALTEQLARSAFAARLAGETNETL